MQRLLGIGLVLCVVFYTRGQTNIPNLEFAHITTAQGLSHGTVNVIFKDSQGYMWFGTGDGLNRYDGHTFEIYKENTLKVGSYRGNYPRGILEDDDGVLWIGTNKGLNCYDPKTEIMEFVPIKGIENGETFIQDMELDKEGMLWLAGTIGLVSYNIQSEVFTIYDQSNIQDFKFRSLFNVERITAAQYYVSSDAQLLTIDIRKKKATEISLPPGSSVIDLAYQKKQGKLWIATRNHGLQLYDESSQSVKTFDVSASEDGISTVMLRELFLDQDDNLWIGTDGEGLHIYLSEEQKFIKYQLENGNDRSLSSNAVLSVLVEPSNVVWVGTYSAGVNHFSPYRYKFKHLQHQQDSKNVLSHNHIISIDHANQGGLWIGTDGGGLDYLDLSQNKIRSHFEQPSLAYQDITIVLDILDDSNNRLWLTTYPGQVFSYDPLTRQTMKIPTASDSAATSNGLPSSFVWTMIEDTQRNVWFATSLPATITKYDSKTKKYYRFDMDCDYVFDIEEGPNGNIWAGTSRDLYRLDVETNELTRYESGRKEGSLADPFINDLYFDRKGTLWVATYNGLSKKLDENTFKTYRTNDGLPNDLVSSIMEDDNGKLWVSTNQGLSLFDPEKETFQNYGIKDGLGGISFKARSAAKTGDGSLYFGGTHGISIVNPSQLMFDRRSPKIKLSRLSIFNQEVLPGDKNSPLNQSISQQKEITLTHRQSVFSLEYTALDYIAPENNQFAYRLVGLEEDWNYVGNRRLATYTSLSPGHYTFQVKASNHDGVWLENPVELNIEVLPPWFNSWPARIGYFVALVLLIYIIVRFRLGFLENQKIKLEKLVKLKTEELASSNHELSTANDALVNANTQLMEKTEELELTLNNLKETQTKLVQSEKMASLGTLTAGVGHEINNPLNFIKGGVEGISNLLQDQEPLDEDKAHKFINIVKEGVKRATMIVKSLSHFSHRSEGMSDECDVHTVIENCLIILGGKLNGKVLVTKNFAEEELILKCNEGRLHQAFLNLLANAEQAIDKEGEIEITTSKNTKHVVVSIRDTGAGIEKKNLEKIMDPFFTTKAPGKGTGLGLSITYNILEEHKGHIDVKSEVGVGTTFTVSLPISR